MSRHTLELAIGAFVPDELPAAARAGRSGKSRRRKRHKRLL